LYLAAKAKCKYQSWVEVHKHSDQAPFGLLGSSEYYGYQQKRKIFPPQWRWKIPVVKETIWQPQTLLMHP